MIKILDGIQPKISDQLSDFLDSKFYVEDIRRVVFEMKPLKAPGKDGLPAIFFQKFWVIIGESVTSACLMVLNDGGIKGWGEKLLSVGGKDIQVKAVVQSIPTYAISLFKLPKSLIDKIQRLTTRFWWGGNEKNRKIHWCTWKRLCKQKSDGGLEFRDLEIFNRSLIAKQCWSYASFYEFIADIATKIDNEALRIFCIICWRSWFLRNTLLHKNGMSKYSEGVAVERVLNNKFLNASYGSIISDIAVLTMQAKVSNVRAIPPFTNRAQCLAKLVLETKTNTFWMEDIPFCIRSLVEADMFS
ncbi:hypothetical protein Ddye_012165 [Dipteronia dyeriana]|uniref:Reverse transcriptase n=1 Tax=Dipteronia dyeriana TaxID=168575 RepID=A0AAD9X3W0_9ROSI|nr:hypothetical protein Ddye_012165 [Dipteronia dyeriana]